MINSMILNDGNGKGCDTYGIAWSFTSSFLFISLFEGIH
jgi:hypothetical protein